MLKLFSLKAKFTVAAVLLGAILSSCGGTADSGSNSQLQRIQDRGVLKCGVSGELPGFSFIQPDGNYAGLDVDICRAVAAAIFDDPSKVEYRNLNAKERFSALQSGEVDILSRNTTWTLSRDSSNKLSFAPVVFYDGQGMMVRKSSGIQRLADFEGKAICTQTGTTTERNLTDQMRKLGVNFNPIVFEDINLAYTAYTEGRCEGVTSDRSQLVSRRSKFPDASEHVILEEVMSKEPLAPAVNDGDDQWYDVVKWVIYSTIEAEELGIQSDNLETFSNSNDPVVARFLGQEDTLGESLGLSNDFAARVIKHVGNYGEIYDRNLGPQTPLKLERGQNQLWSQGGLLYANPFR
ncbi:amino acid ABC transporter substrate-binding protein [Lyngbya confervoides]|uniref:Amino acid ABC transporter substrate-binding protein n=1 Tax=Lyngbya confervoides BDU141951 TaxID=1574623 RepID=A0ABD4SYS4_9CYAN|nr:amino acid ABC transporter substrate-binding protein [Lyngbya confervoides]MCM1981513.1 amino acid ABC transporter substrate-binding protein [Lyngbya confervoides BDU141951]